MDDSHTLAELRELEAMMGVRGGFAAELLQQDEWSLIVRSHALLEAALTQLLVAATDPRLRSFHERLPLGGRSGKLKVTETLGLLDGDALRFIRRLTELSGMLRHDVRQMDFTWAAFLDGLSETGRRQWELHVAAVSGSERQPGTLELVLAVYAVLAKMVFRFDPGVRGRALQRWPTPRTPVAVLVGSAAALAPPDGGEVSPRT